MPCRPVRPYAKAFYQYAKEKNVVTDALHDTQALVSLLKESEFFAEIVSSPVISDRPRVEALKKSIQGKVHEVTFRFMLFLVKKKRLDLLGPICEFFGHLYDDDQGIARADVVCSVPLSDSQIQSLKTLFKKKFQKTIVPNFSIDPSMLGGVTLKWNGKVFDYSLVDQLQRFRIKALGAYSS